MQHHHQLSSHQLTSSSAAPSAYPPHWGSATVGSGVLYTTGARNGTPNAQKDANGGGYPQPHLQPQPTTTTNNNYNNAFARPHSGATNNGGLHNFALPQQQQHQDKSLSSFPLGQFHPTHPHLPNSAIQLKAPTTSTTDNVTSSSSSLSRAMGHHGGRTFEGEEIHGLNQFGNAVSVGPGPYSAMWGTTLPQPSGHVSSPYDIHIEMAHQHQHHHHHHDVMSMASPHNTFLIGGVGANGGPTGYSPANYDGSWISMPAPAYPGQQMAAVGNSAVNREYVGNHVSAQTSKEVSSQTPRRENSYASVGGSSHHFNHREASSGGGGGHASYSPTRQQIFAIPTTIAIAASTSSHDTRHSVLVANTGVSMNRLSVTSLPASAFEGEALAPMIDPIALEVVNAAFGNNSDKNGAQPPTTSDALALCTSRPRVTKKYATTSVGLSLLSLSGPSQPLPLQTLRFYSPDFRLLFEAPLNNLHCTQGLIQFMTRVNRHGFPAPQPPITICKHVYDTIFRKHLDSCSGVVIVDDQSAVEEHHPASSACGPTPHRRTSKQAREWFSANRSPSEKLPEETTPGFPPIPTKWAPVGQEQPAEVVTYSCALASLYKGLDRESWCPLGGKCPHIHPFVVPIASSTRDFQSPSLQSPSSSTKTLIPHPSITWSTVHTTEHPASAHMCFNPGFTFSVAPPNDIAACKSVPSEQVFVTRGVLEFYKFVCLASNNDLPELPAHALELVCPDEVLMPRSKLIAHHCSAQEIAIDDAAPDATGASQKTPDKHHNVSILQHCAHYTKSGVCALGPDCLFVHVVGQGNRMHPRPEDLSNTSSNNHSSKPLRKPAHGPGAHQQRGDAYGILGEWQPLNTSSVAVGGQPRPLQHGFFQHNQGAHYGYRQEGVMSFYPSPAPPQEHHQYFAQSGWGAGVVHPTGVPLVSAGNFTPFSTQVPQLTHQQHQQQSLQHQRAMYLPQGYASRPIASQHNDRPPQQQVPSQSHLFQKQ